MKPLTLLVLGALIALPTLAEPTLSGELKTWHQVTLSFDGPAVSETDETNPFTHYRLNVTFHHASTDKTYVIPGHFAADGDAAESSATAGSVWRTHFAPDRAGEWKWTAQFREGRFVAVSQHAAPGKPAGFMDGATGSFTITPTDKTGRDFRAHGRLEYDGTHYPRFVGSGQYFLKQGPDAPENFLSYADFDGTFHDDGHKDHLVKTWSAHERDWREGDPTWQDDKGKAIIGALNYLETKNMNALSMLMMNVRGDDQNVWPFTDYDTHDRYDVSKLDQWEIVLNHAQELGLFLNIKLNEMESQGVLDNGGLGLETKLYFREMISRYGHLLALNWNLGEENGEWIPNHPTPPLDSISRRAIAEWWQTYNPYNHLVVIHNGFPYDDMMGPAGHLDGIALQIGPYAANRVVQHWRNTSAAAGRPWIVGHDEHGPADYALPPDDIDPDHLPSRQGALWGAMLGGAWGNEWYFGYKHPHSDLTCEDWRTRDRFWEMAAHALDLFADHEIPFWSMHPANTLVNQDDAYVLADPGEIYVIYRPKFSGETTLDMARDIGLYTGLAKERFAGNFEVRWFNPRDGGELATGSVPTITNGGKASHTSAGDNKVSTHAIGAPPSDSDQDWVALIRRVAN